MCPNQQLAKISGQESGDRLLLRQSAVTQHVADRHVSRTIAIRSWGCLPGSAYRALTGLSVAHAGCRFRALPSRRPTGDPCAVRNKRRRRRVVPLEEGVFAHQERIMKKFVVAVLALSALLSGCVAYETPSYSSRSSYGDRDRDRDGIANRYDRDRDGDGVRNSRDARPDNPYRY